MISGTMPSTVAFGLLMCLTCSHVLTAETVFVDRFDDGDAEDGIPVTWVPDSGTWDASSGDYTSAGAVIRRSLIPDHVLGDTSVRTRVRLSGDGSQALGAGIAFRRQPGNALLGYGGSVLADGTIGFLRVDGPPVPIILGASVAPFDVTAQDVILQIDAFGDELSLWAWPAGDPMPTNPHVVVSDATYATGTVGLYSNETPGFSTFRFVHVADTHIPEPSTIVLMSLAAVGPLVLSFARKQLHARRAVALRHGGM